MFRPHPLHYWVVALAAVCLLLATTAANAAGPRAPSLNSPEDDAQVSAVPAFKWSKVKNADRYEFQLSADPNFGSIVGGRGTGSFKTRNLAGTLTKSIADGTYYWRVRGIDAKSNAGQWSARRSFVKNWEPAPQLLGPADGLTVNFPNEPLILRWSRVSRAAKYRVFLATDPTLGSLVLGKPVETSATVFSPGGSLPAGRYFWAVEPIDASNHTGDRSNVGSFVSAWPSATNTAYADLVADARMEEPQLSWAPVPGAVGYQVEINHSEDFAVGSRVCCDSADTGLTDGLVYGTMLSPKRTLVDNRYWWRVRAIDATGNAGQWNLGQPFDAFYRTGTGTIGNLRLRDHVGDLPVGATTNTPIITWDPVPGAATYLVQVTPVENGACNWSTKRFTEYWEVATPNTAFTFLAPARNGVIPVENGTVSVSTDGGKALVPGESYCVRVHARRGDDRIISDPTQLGGIGAIGFTYSAFTPAAPPQGALWAVDSDYLAPRTGGSTQQRVPLLTWNRVAGAHSYYVVVSKNSAFTAIVDIALVNNPAYVPRTRTYADDDTPYYWAILPAKQGDGEEVTTQPSQNAPQSFKKKSVAPKLLSPVEGAIVDNQPVFRWTSGDPAVETPEGAKQYRLQVAQDPTFVDPLDDVTTAATSYTSTRAYPADTVLYWRVRVADANNIGLAWSDVGTFRRRIPAPGLAPDNDRGGSNIPALRWLPVQGASSYTLLVDYTNGTRKEFPVAGTAGTPTVWAGPGIWRWQVRANFPGASGDVSSAFSEPFTYTRVIPAPDGVRAENSGGRVLLSWEPLAATGIKEYRVEFADTDSFERGLQTITTQNLSVAPDITSAPFADGGTIFWRITAIDEVRNLGGSAAGRFVTARQMVLKVVGSVTRGRSTRVVVTAQDKRGRAVRKAKIRVSGRPVGSIGRRTNKRGVAVFRLRAKRKGTVLIRGTRDGFRPAVARLTVR